MAHVMSDQQLRGVPDRVDGERSGSRASQDELAPLVEAAKDGDHLAFAELVEATYVATYTLALRITGDVEDARDVTQEAYLRAYRSLDKFRGDAQFTTWMYRITANCASTTLKRRRRHRHEELPEPCELVDDRNDEDPQLRADASDLRDRLLVALDTLPPKLRAVVVLRDVYGLSHDAIATELGISTTAAKVRLHRARHRLRAEVFPEDDEAEGSVGSGTGDAVALDLRASRRGGRAV
ncbi:MAG TPA: RNA polymerase sigma factor [Microthrixaceae bacterium]|nr:RNA polymerase sigma factor [Microthrixaceae bacterium]